ncbi:unnamed protein product [Caretta caretta]
MLRDCSVVCMKKITDFLVLLLPHKHNHTSGQEERGDLVCTERCAIKETRSSEKHSQVFGRRPAQPAFQSSSGLCCHMSPGAIAVPRPALVRLGPRHTPGPDSGKGAKSLVELLEELECTSDEEIFISQDEIQSFMANNKSFYSNREQYPQRLKEKFNKYCRLNDHKRPICSGWLTRAGAN